MNRIFKPIIKAPTLPLDGLNAQLILSQQRYDAQLRQAELNKKAFEEIPELPELNMGLFERIARFHSACYNDTSFYDKGYEDFSEYWKSMLKSERRIFYREFKRNEKNLVDLLEYELKTKYNPRK